jgi:hypothetical protein
MKAGSSKRLIPEAGLCKALESATHGMSVFGSWCPGVADRLTEDGAAFVQYCFSSTHSLGTEHLWRGHLK